MTDFSRRQFLAGAAAAGAAAVLTSLAHRARAAVPAVGVQAPGFYRYKVGSFECTSINDGARSFPMPDKWVTNVPKEEALAAAQAAYMPKGMVTVPFNPQLVNTGSKLVLIDCGNGVSALEPTKGAAGRTLQNLAAAGVDPKKHRHRADDASASRPHQRYSRAGWLDGVPQCRNHGAGGRLAILDER